MFVKQLLLAIFASCVFTSTTFAISTGDAAPDFELKTHQGESVKLADLKGKIVVLEWFNEGCPFVVKHYKNGHMQKLQDSYSEKGVVWLTINSTNKDHKDYLDAEETAKVQARWNMKTKLLIDAEGTVGKLYGAKATPHMFIINADGKLVYQGAIDDNADIGNDPDTAKNYVAQALEEVLENKNVSSNATKAYGCSVKYAG